MIGQLVKETVESSEFGTYRLRQKSNQISIPYIGIINNYNYIIDSQDNQ